MAAHTAAPAFAPAAVPRQPSQASSQAERLPLMLLWLTGAAALVFIEPSPYRNRIELGRRRSTRRCCRSLSC